MSAALQLTLVWGASSPQVAWPDELFELEADPAPQLVEFLPEEEAAQPEEEAEQGPVISLGFYRKHTESMLRRYLYASMQVGRTPNILGDPVGRGWASSRPVRTFEDAVIFVLDIEKCLNQLGSLDREILSRVVLQEYTQVETAHMLGMSIRSMGYKYPMALDRLTEKLLDHGLLILPV
jgi:hypothetical protein